MRTQITSAAVAIALLSNGVDARKEMVNQAGRQVGTPNVRDCDALCIFEDIDEKNYWCLDFSTPHIKAGWEWKLTNNTEEDSTPFKHLRVSLIGYFEFQFEVVSNFVIDNFYKNNFTVKIPSFDASMASSFIVNEKGQFCPGLGANIDSIDLKLSMIHNMMNCTKTLLKNFWSVEGIWTGKSAQLFEDCEWSQNDSENDPEVDLDFTTFEFLDKIEDYMVFGTIDPDSASYCFNIFGTELAILTGSHD